MPNLYCYKCNHQHSLEDNTCRHCNAPLLLYSVYQLQGILQNTNDNGTVYRARHRKLNADLVVKQAPLNLAGYIRNEAKILQSLRRRLDFTPHVYDFRDEDSHVVLIMEYIEGNTLDQVHPQRTWPIAEVQSFIIEMLMHLIELHSASIIHRDIKPQNIILRPNNSYAMIDFNIAKHKGEKTEFIGHTRRYAPPEQFAQSQRRRGGSSLKQTTDERSDLYSLGATAYELLTGQMPAPGNTFELPSSIQGEPLPQALRGVLASMLASQMTARPRSAEKALQALQPDRYTELISQLRHPLSPERILHTGNTFTWVDRGTGNDSLLDAEADTALASPSALVVRAPTTQAPTTAAYSRPAATSIEDSWVFPEESARGRITGIAWSPSNPELAIATARGIRIFTLHQPTERVVRSTSEPVRSISYTNNGQALAWAMGNHIHICNTSGENLYHRAISFGFQPWYVQGIANRQSLLIAHQGGLQLIDTASEQISHTCALPIEPHFSVCSAQGERIVTISDQKLTVWRSNLAEASTYPWHGYEVPALASVALTPNGRVLAIASERGVELWQNEQLERIEAADSSLPVRLVAVNPGAQRLAILTSAGIHIYNRETKRRAELPQSGDIAARCFQMSFDREGKYLAIATPGTIKIWDIGQRKLIETLHYTDNPRYLAFAHDDELLAAVGHDIHIHDVRNRTPSLRPHSAKRTSHVYHGVAFAQDGRLAAACGQTMMLWKRRSVAKNAQTFLATAVGDPNSPNSADTNPWRSMSPLPCLCVQPQGLVFRHDSSPDLLHVNHAKVDIYTVASSAHTSRRSAPFPTAKHTQTANEQIQFYDVALAPSGWVASAAANKTIHIWNVDDRDDLPRTLELDFLPNNIAISPNGELVAAANHTAIEMWNAFTGKRICAASDAGSGAERVMFAPDNATLAAIRQTEICIWRLENAALKLLYRAQGHTDSITDVAFTKDAQTFASASDDGTIRVWANKIAATLSPSGSQVVQPPPFTPPSPQPRTGKKLKIFLCYVTEDRARVDGLRQHLRLLGFNVWDTNNILPGEPWQNRIKATIREVDAFIPCLSPNLLARSGSSFAHDEINMALDYATTLPKNSIYIIPLRLGTVQVPDRLRIWQWVDYFSDNVPGELVAALEKRAQEVTILKREKTKSPRRKNTEIKNLLEDLDQHRKYLYILQRQINISGIVNAPPEKIFDMNNRRLIVRQIKTRLEKLQASYTSDLIDEDLT